MGKTQEQATQKSGRNAFRWRKVNVQRPETGRMSLRVGGTERLARLLPS